jgi:hypothetical protein
VLDFVFGVSGSGSEDEGEEGSQSSETMAPVGRTPSAHLQEASPPCSMRVTEPLFPTDSPPNGASPLAKPPSPQQPSLPSPSPSLSPSAAKSSFPFDSIPSSVSAMPSSPPPQSNVTATGSASAAASPAKGTATGTVSSSADSLPPGWERCFTPRGKLFYINHHDRTTHWQLPSAPPPAPSSPHLKQEHSESHAL